MSAEQLILGIDGGGTKTMAWLAVCQAGVEQVIAGRGQSGPANPRAVGFERATENLDKAIRNAFESARRPFQEVPAACLALAGTDRESDRAPLRRWAKQRRVAQQLLLVNDGQPVLACGTPAGWGIALIAGTGSFAYGRNEEGEAARVGGWGYLFGDEGSGYALGVAGLRAAASCADGRGPDTSLLPRLLDALQIAAPSELIEAIYHRDFDRRAVADLAPLVFAAADESDAVAAEIVETAASELAEMVDVLRRRLRIPNPELPLALAGSVILRGRLLKERLLSRLRATFDIPPFVSEVAEPVRGALVLARRAINT